MDLLRKSFKWAVFLVWGLFVAVLACGLIYDRIAIAKFQSDIERLAPETGRLEVEDPSKLKIALVKSDFPESIRWRIYSAGNKSMCVRCEVPEYSSGTTIWHRDQLDNLLLWKWDRLNASGRISMLHGSEQAGGDSVHLLEEVDQFLYEHQHELDVEILGSEEPVVAEPDGVVTLVKASLSEELLELARKELSSEVYAHLSERPLILLRMGTWQMIVKTVEEEEGQRGQK